MAVTSRIVVISALIRKGIQKKGYRTLLYIEISQVERGVGC